MTRNNPEKILIGVTGASGSIYAKTLAEQIFSLNKENIKVDMIFSENAYKVWEYELGNQDYKKLPYKIFGNHDFFAPPASGSAGYDTMIICPCTMGTLGKIAAGVASDLISRAADVMLKEKRTLILAVREAPFNLIHIKNMETVTLAGGTIFPANPYFYNHPASINELVETVTGRILQLAGFDINIYKWNDDI